MGMMDKLLDSLKLNPDEDFDDDEFDGYDDEGYGADDYDMPSGPSERELRRAQAAEEKAAKKEMKRREKEEAAILKESRQIEKEAARSSARSSSLKGSKVTPINNRANAGRSGSSMVVRVFKPTAIDDEVAIVDTILEHRTVIINMEGFDLAVAQRIIDFTIGATYAIGGDLQRISNFIFLATPPGVDISGDIAGLKEQYNAAETEQVDE